MSEHLPTTADIGDCEPNYPIGVNDILGRKDDGVWRRGARRYFFSRNPERSVKLHTALGAPLARAAIMGSYGKLMPNSSWSNYRLDSSKPRVEAATRFAVGGSVFNEVVHSVAALGNIYTLQAELHDGSNPAVSAAALVVNSVLVSLQRYNRARLTMRIDEELKAGARFDEGYTNWMGVDGTVFDSETTVRMYTQEDDSD